jgi:PleD family two-component response regulator
MGPECTTARAAGCFGEERRRQRRRSRRQPRQEGPRDAIRRWHDPAGRILVVDDTAFNRQLLARLLQGIGHESVEVGDGMRALQRLRDPNEPPIDVILLDIVMPEWMATPCSPRSATTRHLGISRSS